MFTICQKKFIFCIIAHHNKIPIKLTIICTKNLNLGDIHFISSIIAIIAKNIAHINKAHILLYFQYQDKNKIIDNIVDNIIKIHISFGTGVVLFKSLYFRGLSNIQNFLNKNNHNIPTKDDINIVPQRINISLKNRS